MKNVYTYRSVLGGDISDDFDGDVEALRREYVLSGTPISSINGVPEDLTKFLQSQIDSLITFRATLQKSINELKSEQRMRAATLKR